jgi:hypothetical protein
VKYTATAATMLLKKEDGTAAVPAKWESDLPYEIVAGCAAMELATPFFASLEKVKADLAAFIVGAVP